MRAISENITTLYVSARIAVAVKLAEALAPKIKSDMTYLVKLIGEPKKSNARTIVSR